MSLFIRGSRFPRDGKSLLWAPTTDSLVCGLEIYRLIHFFSDSFIIWCVCARSNWKDLLLQRVNPLYYFILGWCLFKHLLFNVAAAQSAPQHHIFWSFLIYYAKTDLIRFHKHFLTLFEDFNPVTDIRAGQNGTWLPFSLILDLKLSRPVTCIFLLSF